MKRDMDLIRELLLFSEAHCDGISSHAVSINNFKLAADHRQLGAHIKLLEEQGLLTDGHATFDSYGLGNLTWHGHEYLDAIRDPEIWRETKDVAKSAGGWGIEIFKEIAVGLIKSKVKSYTGLEL